MTCDDLFCVTCVDLFCVTRVQEEASSILLWLCVGAVSVVVDGVVKKVFEAEAVLGHHCFVYSPSTSIKTLVAHDTTLLQVQQAAQPSDDLQHTVCVFRH